MRAVPPAAGEGAGSWGATPADAPGAPYRGRRAVPPTPRELGRRPVSPEERVHPSSNRVVRDGRGAGRSLLRIVPPELLEQARDPGHVIGIEGDGPEAVSLDSCCASLYRQDQRWDTHRYQLIQLGRDLHL